MKSALLMTKAISVAKAKSGRPAQRIINIENGDSVIISETAAIINKRKINQQQL